MVFRCWDGAHGLVLGGTGTAGKDMPLLAYLASGSQHSMPVISLHWGTCSVRHASNRREVRRFGLGLDHRDSKGEGKQGNACAPVHAHERAFIR